MSSDLERYPKIDLGTQPWSVISFFEGKAVVNHVPWAITAARSSTLSGRRLEPTHTKPTTLLLAPAKACSHLCKPLKYARIAQALGENT